MTKSIYDDTPVSHGTSLFRAIVSPFLLVVGVIYGAIAVAYLEPNSHYLTWMSKDLFVILTSLYFSVVVMACIMIHGANKQKNEEDINTFLLFLVAHLLGGGIGMISMGLALI